MASVGPSRWDRSRPLAGGMPSAMPPAQRIFWDQFSAGVHTSKQGTYVSYNTNANTLKFPDGSFWVMGSQSTAYEPDAGSLYPTQIQALNSEPAYYINLVVGTRCGTDENASRAPLLYGRSGWCCSRRAVGVGPNCPSEAALEGDQ
jgi:hypothetical protein